MQRIESGPYGGLMPREKLYAYGSQYLSDHELMAILLGSGVRGKNIFRLAEEVLAFLEKHGFNADPDLLTGITGLGTAKACLLNAALEFARRTICPEPRRISHPRDIYPVLDHYADRKQEHFLCVSLNGAHEIQKVRIVSVGLLNRTIVHPREVYAEPVRERAAAVIVAHNHPSGNLQASDEDREITARLRQAGDILGIPLLDHIIFARTGYISLLEEGIL